MRVWWALRQGAGSLVRLGPAASGAMGRWLRHPVHGRTVRRVLRKLGAPARPGLLRLLARTRDGRLGVRVLEVLGRLDPPDAAPLLPYLEHDRKAWRLAALKALGRQGGPQALKAMARLVQTDDPLRGRAREALFASQAPAALGLLVQVAISGEDVRERLPERVRSLGYMAVAPLIEVLRRADDPVRDLVVDLLQVPDDPRALIIMAKGLEEDDPRIAEVVVRALVARGGAALPYLRHLLEHPDQAVRQRAERVVRASDPAVEEVP